MMPARQEPRRALAGQTSGRSSFILTSTGDTDRAAGEEPQMLDHYFAALFSLGQTRGLAHSAPPDAP